MQYALKFLRKVILQTRKYDRMTEINKSEFYAEKIIANAGSFALAIILFFGIYEVTVIFGFT